MKIRVIVEPDEDVFVAYCPDLPGCVTYGATEEEALGHISEAVELYLRPVPDSEVFVPEEATLREVVV